MSKYYFNYFFQNSLVMANQYEFLPRSLDLQIFVQKICNPADSSNQALSDLCLTLVGNIYGDNRRNLDPVSN